MKKTDQIKCPMPYHIDQDILDKTVSCTFEKKCLDDNNGHQFCGIIEGSPNFLLVSPRSPYKVSHCSYNQELKTDGYQIHICHCPVRLELYRKYKK